MNLSSRIAKHFRDVHFGGNWTGSDLKGQLKDVTWQEAVTRVHDLNTIATLTYHISYYVEAVLQVLKGGQLNAKDEYSFSHPPINSKEDWDLFLDKCWINAEKFSTLIEQLPDDKLSEDFTNEKYGNYYRNLNGIIEHTHYHLGQIALIKKILREENH